MSELDRLVNSCLLPGFAGPTLPEWTSQALEDGLAGVWLYGPNLPAEGPAADAITAIGRSVRTAAPDALRA